MLPHFALAALVLAVGLALASQAAAHCDTLDGPVVQAARRSLETGDPNLTLIWVEKAKEAEILAAFAKARAVRSLSPEAKDLADTWFFETVVRIHRAGEGEPYTGLKPAGQVEPPIAAADRAVATGTLVPLEPFVPAEHRAGFQEALAKVLALKSFALSDVEAGRAYVKAYVAFLHRLEHLPHAAAPAGGGPVALSSPKPLADEHAELHARLAEALDAGGETAAAARSLAKILHPHFVREEEIAMPPLSLLPALARGEVSPAMRPALEMTHALEKELPRMLEEHVAIKAGFRALHDAAEREGQSKIARFALRLVTHAENEEAVLYPAALLVGRWLEAHLPK